ncbi:hypothetical protein BJ508DRAFT_415623 [Ascobolus immersus RN42]|uniref:FZ domain-containing protein n=1 Tax=Ascobolus immersus RN42 TaxID=1160509 RepID=A0A3N4IE38_ASCIM|nr:hypothetical protein BJ508DRAFT_415623 [Ascobolus immersus RN42]
MFGYSTKHQRSTLRLLIFLFGLLQIAWASNRPIRDDEQTSAMHNIFSPTSPALLDPPVHTPQHLHVNVKRQNGNEPIRNLTNGNAHNMNIEFGMAQYWSFSRREIENEPEYLTTLKNKDKGGSRNDLRKRQKKNNKELEQRTVYISFNTCTQPQPVNDTMGLSVAQLELYVSTNRRNIRPGPTVVNMDQEVILIDQGLGTLELNVTDEFYLGVYAPNVTDNAQRLAWRGSWNYELAVSTKSLVHNKEIERKLFLIDADYSSALLISSNLTEEVGVEVTETPYEMYAYNNAFRNIAKGIENSYCAVRQLSQAAGAAVKMSITKRGQGNFPKQQFHMMSLNSSSVYRVYMTKKGDPREGEAPGGGILYPPVTVYTKSDVNCQVVFDLNFCSEVAYAVPANPTIFGSQNELGSFYDNIAKDWYKNFTTSLQQIPCNATNDAKYSLAKSCDDCAHDYKTWLCAVTIPRCEDFARPGSYLQPRGIGTSFYNKSSGEYVDNEEASDFFINRTLEENVASYKSRNTLIDEVIKPGPYKEIKPCIDLCYSIVQSCPADFGFSCPKDGSFAMMNSYGQRSDNTDGSIKCSYLGAVINLNDANGLLASLSWWRLLALTVATVFLAGIV